ncbi:hypothetical protein BHE74_00004480 [Ensete ventricosum]|nr:hypothetical protein BHE74_00004480 [Ensete ventricosum]
MWDRSSPVRLALPLLPLERGRIVRQFYRRSGMGRGCGTPFDINGAFRGGRVVECPNASTSDAESTADLAAWAVVVSSQLLMWLSI